MTGIVFSIEEFSVYDGPGIRTTVFLKGCPLRCTWCHNPEGQLPAPQILRSPNGCIHCGRCAQNGVRENGVLRYTQQSIDSCPMGLLRICGDAYTPEALCRKILKNREMLETGGVTFSGGEPLLQADFLFACLENLQGALHTAIQTCGYCQQEIFEKALTLADYFLFDLKLADPGVHRQFTGVSNDRILENYRLLANSGKPFVTRIPLIPGVTDTRENITGIIKILKAAGVDYAELLPYNKMAGGKYALTGRDYCPGFDETKEVALPGPLFTAENIDFQIL